MASWTSGKAPQKLAKTLNVGTTYLLREVEAPGEYRLANDVEFVIDNYGNVTITKGTENGNAELSDNTITLYDTMMDAEGGRAARARNHPRGAAGHDSGPDWRHAADPGHRPHRAGESDRPYRSRPPASCRKG